MLAPFVFLFFVVVVVGSIAAALIALGRARRSAERTADKQLSFLQRNGMIWLGFLFAAAWGIVALINLYSYTVFCGLSDNAADCIRTMSAYSLAFWAGPVLGLFGLGWIVSSVRSRSGNH